MSDGIVPGIQPDRLKALLKQMLNVYSPSGKEEEILDFVSGYLSSHGLPVTRQQVDEHRSNLLVLPRDPEDVSLCFVGHLDTVSAYDLDEFGFREENGAVYGLGAADMKAGCAAMIETFTVMAEAGRIPPEVGLALVVDEEEENSGARALVDEYNFPWAVIGEPTNLVPCLGHFGYLEVQLRTRGKRAHPAVPEHGQNAIAGMLQLLLSVTEFASSKAGELVYNIRDLSVFPLGFVVPENCEAWLDFHLPPNSRMDVVKSELEQLIRETSSTSPPFEAELRFEETHAGYMISPDRPMVKLLKQVYDSMSLAWEPADFRSDSDANILWAAGVDPIILGPGRLEEAHTPEECVSFAQVLDAARVYLDLALRMPESTS
jgi:acetylornithine deacetylase